MSEWYAEPAGEHWCVHDGDTMIAGFNFTEAKARHLAGCSRLARLVEQCLTRYNDHVDQGRELTAADHGKLEVLRQLRRAYESDPKLALLDGKSSAIDALEVSQ